MAQLLDYANLDIDARVADIRLLCLEAEKYGVSTVLVNPVNVSLAAEFLEGSQAKVAAAISYPVGAYPPEIKEREVEDAIENGADEIVMLMAIGVFREGLHDQTRAEMEALVRAAGGRTSKIIIEAAALTDKQKETACRMAVEAGIDYVVTSTGFEPGGFSGATAEDVELLARAAGGAIGIVASGGIHTLEEALALLEAGASRICTQDAPAILKGFRP